MHVPANEGRRPALDDAIAGEQAAIAAWRQLVAAAGDVYADDLMMGAAPQRYAGIGRTSLPRWKKDLPSSSDSGSNSLRPA